MKLAIMQPYLFSYIGYFQLINAVDKFVVLDNVQYINKGWINRNNILVNGQANMFTFSVQKDSREKNINERFFAPSYAQDKANFLQKLQHAYSKAPMYKEVIGVIEKSLDFTNDANIADSILFNLKQICEYLEIKAQFTKASTIFPEKNVAGADYILAICEKLGATVYINPIGGTELYDKKLFLDKDIELFFLNTYKIEYQQFKNDFIPNLSIIDILMFNSKQQIAVFLERCEFL